MTAKERLSKVKDFSKKQYIKAKDFSKKHYHKVKEKYFSSETYIEDEKHSKSLVKTFIVLALIFGILIIMLSPPFVQPDENAHYLNVFRIVNGSFFPQVSNGVLGGLITEDQMYVHNMFKGQFSTTNTGTKFNYWTMDLQDHLEMEADKLIFFPNQNANINPFSYIVQVCGANIGLHIFGLENPYSLLLSAKFFTLIFYVIVTALAIKTTPVLKRTMFLVALMPMSLYQGASISYDAIVIPISFLFFAYAMKIILSPKDYRININDVLAICLCTFVFITTKVAYAPMIVVLLAISVKKFGNLKKYFACVGIVVVIGLVFYFGPQLFIRPVLANITSSGVNTSIVNAQAQHNAFVRENPFYIVEVIFNTFDDQETMDFWRRTFFGSFGAFQVNFPQFLEKTYYIILFTCAILELSVIPKFSIKARALSVIGPIISALGTIIGMYIIWTPIVLGPGADLVSGVQGRYFIPIFLMGIMLFANPLLYRFKHTKKIMAVSTEVCRFTTLLYSIVGVVLLLVAFWI